MRGQNPGHVITLDECTHRFVMNMSNIEHCWCFLLLLTELFSDFANKFKKQSMMPWPIFQSRINFILSKLVILLPNSPRPWLSLSIYDQDQYQAEENFLTQVRKTEFLTYKSPFQNCCMSSIDCLDLFWQSKWYRYKLVSLYCTNIQVYTILLKVGTKYQISNDKQTQVTL